jgi:hypothetical protein
LLSIRKREKKNFKSSKETGSKTMPELLFNSFFQYYGSGFNQVSGSGSRPRRAKMTYKERKKSWFLLRDK